MEQMTNTATEVAETFNNIVEAGEKLNDIPSGNYDGIEVRNLDLDSAPLTKGDVMVASAAVIGGIAVVGGIGIGIYNLCKWIKTKIANKKEAAEVTEDFDDDFEEE